MGRHVSELVGVLLAGVTHGHGIADVAGLQTALDGKQAAGSFYTQSQVDGFISPLAPKASPLFTGLPAAPTAIAGTNSTQIATTAFVSAAIANVINSAPGALDTLNELATALGNDPSFATTITNSLAGKQPLDSDLTAIAALVTTGYGRSFLDRADAAAARTLLALGSAALAATTDFAAAAHVGSGGAAHANAVASGAAGFLTGADKAKLDGIATAATANSTDTVLSTPYRTLLDSSGSHTAARVAGTYGLGQGDPLAIAGTGTLYPLNIIYLDPADYPAIGALAAKLRIRCIVECNDVAPTGNYTVGLYPVTRPATSGGAGLCIYSLGTVVTGSTAASNAPAADTQTIIASADFAVPTAGFYVIGVLTTAAPATSAHMHFSAQLQFHHA